MIWHEPHALVKLRSRGIDVWRIRLDAPEAVTSESQQLLSADELARANSFHFPRDQRRFVVAHASLRGILAGYIDSPPCDVRFTTGAYGKPYLESGELHFNLSHSDELALVAVTAEGEIGVDIEKIHPLEDAVALAERFFSARELHELRKLERRPESSRAFFECWTRKEAYIKATGMGLSYALDGFHVTFFPEEKVELRIHSGEDARWSLYNLSPAPGYCAALAVSSMHENAAERKIRQFSWPVGGLV